MHNSGAARHGNAKPYVDLSLKSLRRGSDPDSVIPGRCQRVRAKRGPMTGSASNPESRDSPMRNCASEVWSCGPPRNDGVWIARHCDPLARNDGSTTEASWLSEN